MITLPFPPSSLSGHNTGHWATKSSDTAALRLIAKQAVRREGIRVSEEGDIRLHLHFVPPDNRGDRCNYWNRSKCLIDGIADGLKTSSGKKVNDRRFLPSMSFGEPEKPGRVEVTLG